MEQKDECIRRAYKLLDKSRKYNKKDDLNNSVMMNKKTAFEILMCKYMFILIIRIMNIYFFEINWF